LISSLIATINQKLQPVPYINILINSEEPLALLYRKDNFRLTIRSASSPLSPVQN